MMQSDAEGVCPPMRNATMPRPRMLALWILLLPASLMATDLDALREQLDEQPGAVVENLEGEIEAAELAGDYHRLGEAEMLRGRAHVALEEPTLGQQALERAADAFEAANATARRAEALKELGGVRVDQEEHDAALEVLYQAFPLMEEMEREGAMATILTRIGRSHFMLGDPETAEEYFRRERDLQQRLDDTEGYASSLNNLAVVARHREDLDEAEALNQRALALREEAGDIGGMAASYANLAVVAWERGDLETTEEQHQMALELYRQADDRHGQALTLHNLGYTYMELENLERSADYLERAEAVINEIDSDDLRLGNYERMAELEALRGNYEAALEARTRQVELQERMHDAARQRQIAEMHALFEVEEREQEIELLQQQQRTQALIRNGLVAGAAGLLLILFLLYNRFRLKSRANQMINARNEELAAMDRIVAAMNTEDDFANLLGRILEEALGFFAAADRGAFLVREEDGEHFRVAIWQGYRYSGIQRIRLSRERAEQRYFEDGEMLAPGVYLHKHAKSITGHEDMDREDPYQAMLAISIELEGSLAGFLILQSRNNPEAFTTTDQENYSRFREHAISAYRRARYLEQLEQEKERAEQAHQEMEQLARRDTLTGLPNRRHMQEQLEAEQVRVQRNARAMSVILCDIDHFKKINDQRGHEAGDVILQHVAGLLAGRIRAQDIVARWGGEEFLLLLPETELDGARSLAETLRALIAMTPASYDGDSISVSMTFGVAQYTPGDKNLDSVIRRADEALYEGKDDGRNRVCMAQAEMD